MDKFLYKLKSVCARLLSYARRCIFYRHYDAAEYYRGKAKQQDQSAVLWSNQEYNQFVRMREKQIFENHLKELPANSRILDICCGIGVVSKMLVDMRKDFSVDAVDIDEMIEVAKVKNFDSSINYIASTAEDYRADAEIYDVILSSGGYSAIRDIGKLECSLDNGIMMLKKGGVFLMIDPFHSWNFLARAKYSTDNLIDFFKRSNMTLEYKSCILFWPFREWLANSVYHGDELKKRVDFGELLLKKLGYIWGDYKVLVFRKPV
jgi:2-polyprenyl-3-methyl-5-hydroxy-6-metoxy-1,4-benzoquinol methylase